MAVASYMSVRSVSFRYHYRRKSSSSAQGGPNGAKARARQFPLSRPPPLTRVEIAPRSCRCRDATYGRSQLHERAIRIL